MEEKFYTTKEVAELLQVHDVTILRMIRSGRIPALNLGKGKKHAYRISKLALDDFIKNSEYDPGS